VFETLSDRLTQVFSALRGRGRLSQADIDATMREIRIALLEADVALPVVRQFVARVKERASGEEVSAALNPAQQIVKIVNEELIGILGGEARRLRFAKVPPTVIMLAGLQGSGKTTLAAKLALWLKAQGNTPLMVAADLQRPNAVQQLQILGERAGVPVFAPSPGNGVGDPVAVARQSLDEARRRQHNMVIIDTAGRLGIDAEMMTQAVAIRDATEPDEVLFVVDAMIGQAGWQVAQSPGSAQAGRDRGALGTGLGCLAAGDLGGALRIPAAGRPLLALLAAGVLAGRAPRPGEPGHAGDAAREHRAHLLLALEEVRDQLGDLTDRDAGPLGDAGPAGAVDDLRVAALLRRHGPDDGLRAVQVLVVDLGE
jgi:Ni2+-binding GTPase involved in maturation of urease and hydrogenase